MYGGTKEEMQRLLDDAEKISGIHYDISSFADIVDAIHVVQTEMGITGTTAKEAGTTIQGSVASMKSAWTNLLTGLADGNADIEQLVDDLVTTVVGDGTESNLGVLGNILPAVETALNGASTLVSKALPKIMEIIPAIINDNLPVLMGAAVGIVQSLMDGISQNQEMLFDTIFGVVAYLAETFITMLPEIVQIGLDLIVSLSDGISESLPELIPVIVDVVLQIVDTLIENAPKLFAAALTLIVTLAKSLIANIPELLKAITKIVDAIVSGFTTLMSKITGVGRSIVTAVGNGIKSLASSALTWGKDLIDNFVSGIKSKISAVTSAVSGIASKIKSLIGFSEPEEGPLSDFHTYMPDMLTLMAKGIRDNAGTALEAVSDLADDMTKAMQMDTFGVGVSPEFDATVAKAAANGLEIRYASVAAEASSYSTFSDRLDAQFEHLFQVLSEYFPQFASAQVVLDTGATVGQMAPAMDVALNRIATARRRGG